MGAERPGMGDGPRSMVSRESGGCVNGSAGLTDAVE